MNWKKISLILIVFLTFLATGFMLSNIQSREADQLLDAHGMSNNTHYFYTNKKQNIGEFLTYLRMRFPKDHIQVHLDNQKEKEQVLVWANYKIQSLPTQKGQYFSPDDFKGQISFAVLGPDTKNNVVELQGNQYVIYKKHYYSVIGEFKNYHQTEQKKYYLTTGIKQATSKEKLKNFKIIIDSPNRNVIKTVGEKYHAKLEIPAFVKSHQYLRLSVLKEIFLILLFWIIGIICNIFIALIEWRQVKLAHLKRKFFVNWLINRGLRLILIETLLAIIALVILQWTAFFNKSFHLLEIIVVNWSLVLFTYIISWIIINKKEKKDA